MASDVIRQLDEIAAEADNLVKNLDHYWNGEGVSELGIFIDPDLYQYLERLYIESVAFATRCRDLHGLADQLRAAAA